MASKLGEEPLRKSPLGIILIIVSELFGVVMTTGIHYYVLTENSPGYPSNDFLINFLWMDILVGLAVGFGIYVPQELAKGF